MNGMSSEELALLFNGNTINKDDIFKELHNRFRKMAYKFVNKHVRYGYIEEDELISLVHEGLLKGIMSYTKDKKVKLSTVVYRYIQTAIHHRYDYMKRYNREEVRNTMVSLSSCIENKYRPVPLIEYINHEDSKDEYFRNELVHIKDAVDYAMDKLGDSPFKKYVIPVLLGEYSQQELARELNVHYRKIQYQVQKFKKFVKEYIHSNNIELIMG